MIWYYFTRFLCNWLLFLLGGRLSVKGVDHIPAQGPYILVANHMSIADGPIVLMAHPPRWAYFWIADKWKTLPVFGFLAARVGAIFINRDVLDRAAIRQAVEMLKAGEIVGLAPEATRSPIGQIIKPRNGAAYLATRANVPIVPIGITGSNKLFHNFLRLRRTPITVRFGEPFMLPMPAHRPRQSDLTRLTDDIMQHVLPLIPVEQHGYYR
jgi:1-acyl-sn-glycerol-3-phosphate acyltransferase